MSKILTGRVLKNYNGYYYVSERDSGELYTCKVKGKMKQNRFSLATGDLVNFEAEGYEGMIVSVQPRKNYLLRPIMANLDLLVATFACCTPDFSTLIADKLLLLAEEAHIPAIIVLNKVDLAPEGLVEQIRGTYEPLGYEVFPISAKSGRGVEALRERLKGKLCAFGGPSGVGKSSTIHAVDSSVELRTGVVSEKIGRGKHTTRYAELLPFDEGYIADTPGFGNLRLEGFEKEKVEPNFREFRIYDNGCKYSPCTHTHEPICGIKAALEQGKIAASRYESYLAILDEVKLLQEREGRKKC